MFIKNVLLSAAAASVVTISAPSEANAGTACRSTWVKSTSVLKKFYGPVSKLVCKKMNTDNPAAAQKCIDQAKKAAKDAVRIKKEWNKGEDGSWKIGPRALPMNSPQQGAVSTERQFVGQPAINDTYSISLERTGGKAKKDLIVKICFVDQAGNDVAVDTFRLSKKGKKKWSKTYKNVEGSFPVLHLNNQRWGANAHKYKLTTRAQGEPSALQNARKTVAANKSKKGKSSKKGRNTDTVKRRNR